MAESLWGTPVSAKRTVGAGTLIMPSGEEKGIYPDYAETAAILKTMNVPEDFHSTGSIRFIHRRTDSEEIYFVSNRAAAKSDVTCTFRVGRGAPQLWDPATGETRALPVFSRTGQTTSIPMTFEAHQSFFVIFPRQTTSGAGEQAKGVNFPSLKPVATLAGSWDLAFDPERGGPAKVRFEALQDWSTHTEKGIRYYSGLATYGKSFDLPDGVEKDDTVYLDLGTVHDMCRVRLNGQDLGVVWTAPWRVDVTGVVKAAGNQLEIEVANRWNNRLVGDQQVPDTNARTLKWESGLLGGRSYKTGRYTFSTRNPCRANTRLLPSGLLGPVRIMNDL
jgi:hypothetical protein